MLFIDTCLMWKKKYGNSQSLNVTYNYRKLFSSSRTSFFSDQILAISNFSIFQYIYISPHEPNTNVVILMQHFFVICLSTYSFAYNNILFGMTMSFFQSEKEWKKFTKLNAFNSILSFWHFCYFTCLDKLFLSW